MENISPDHLKILAARIAESMASADGLATIRYLRLMGVFGDADRSEHGEFPGEGRGRGTRGAASSARRVGIWQAEGGVFVRAQDMAAEWARWANTHRIRGKGTKRRIAFLGESVARGFFYDPLFNVAKAFEVMLRSEMGDEVEVVDLAQTNQTLPQLIEVFEGSFDLEPDAIVIMAGNNWANAVPISSDERCMRSAALRDGGIAALKQHYEDGVARQVANLTSILGTRSRERDVPVLFLVPEFNLGDWHDARPIAPLLLDDKNQRWRECMQQARAALIAGNLDKAATIGAEMVALDEGVAPSSLKILGECALRAGRVAEARRFLERARDASIWDPMIRSPRTFTVVQNQLRRGCAANSVAIVDLPAVFADHLRGELPDRRLFIDYCHLSVDGIRVAMAATTAALLPLLGRPAGDADKLARIELPVTPAIEAQAHFAAAIHSAHWGHDNEAIVEYHCKAALAKDPAVEHVMRTYMDLMTRHAPGWMCTATETLSSGSGASNPALARYVLGMLPSQPKVMDRRFFAVVERCLKEPSDIDRLRIAEHGRRGQTISLLTAYLSVDSPRESFWLLPGAERRWPSYYRAYEAESRFLLVEEEPSGVALRITARLPRRTKTPGDLEVIVNGQLTIKREIGPTWSTVEALVDARQLRRGVNEISLRWPTPTAGGAEGISLAAEAVELERTPEFFPVLGEVHSLVCRSR
jgi:hypothetical protein